MKKKLDDSKPKVRQLRALQPELQAFHSDEIDKEPVEEEATKVADKHEELCYEVSQYLDTLDRIHDKSEKFFADVNDIKSWAPGVKDQVKESDVTSKNPEELQKELERLDVRIFSPLYIQDTISIFHGLYYLRML